MNELIQAVEAALAALKATAPEDLFALEERGTALVAAARQLSKAAVEQAYMPHALANGLNYYAVLMDARLPEDDVYLTDVRLEMWRTFNVGQEAEMEAAVLAEVARRWPNEEAEASSYGGALQFVRTNRGITSIYRAEVQMSTSEGKLVKMYYHRVHG